MSSFDDREKAFENKYAHDEELRFKTEARRNRLLGQWAADKMGVTGDEADAYAKAVVMADFEEAGDEDVYRKVAGDFDEAKVTWSESELRGKMVELMATAKQQIMTETD